MPQADGQILIDVALNTSQAYKDAEMFAKRAERIMALPLGKMGKSADEFSKSLEASNARVIAFGASAGIIFGIQRAFTGLLKATVDVEKQLKDINVIFNLSNKSLQSFGDSLFNIAKQTGQSFKIVADAATELSRQGLGVEETLKRTRDALILTRLSGLDAKESVEDLTAALNTFGELANDSTTLINKLATVDSKFAVSSRDLADALKRVGSTATDTGVSFDSLIALVTSAQQVTARGGSVIGNAFKTIFQRLNRPETLDFLENFNISVRNLQGEALASDKILLNLAQTFSTLTAEQKNQVVQLSAGVFQANVFRAILQDLGKATSFYGSALNTANQATDEAIKRNEELNLTLRAVFDQFKNNLTQTGSKIGETAFSPAIKSVLSSLNGLLESFNNRNGLGAKIGEGLLKGLGQYLSGPGAVIIGLTISKLLYDLSKFTGTALKTFLSLNGSVKDNISLSQQRLSVEQKILGVLQSQAVLKAGQGGALSSGFSPYQIQGKQPFLNNVQGPLMFRGLSPQNTNMLNGEMMKLLEISQNARFNLGAASAHLARMARNLGMADSEVSQLLGVFKTNIANAKAFSAAQLKAASLIPGASQLFFGGKARAELGNLNPQALTAINAERNSKIQNRVFGASMFAPLITSAAGEMMASDETLYGRRAKSVLSGVGDTASYAGLGALMGGPAGAGIGAGAGAIWGISKAIMSWNDTLPDLERSLQNITESISSTTAGFADLNLLIDNLRNASNEKDRDRIAASIQNRISSFSPDLQSKISSSLRSKGVGGLEDVRNESLKNQALQKQLEELKVFVEINKGKFGSISPSTGSGAFDSADLNYTSTKLSGESKSIMNGLAGRLGELGLGEIIADPEQVGVMKSQLTKNPDFPLKALTSALRNKGKFAEASGVSGALGGLNPTMQKLIIEELLSNQFSKGSQNLGSVYKDIVGTANNEDTRYRYTTNEVNATLSRMIKGRETSASDYRLFDAEQTILEESGLSQMAVSNRTELDKRSRFLSPIKATQLEYNLQQDYLINQNKTASAKNTRSLNGYISNFGLNQFMGLRDSVSGNTQGSGEFLSMMDDTINAMELFKSGKFSLPDLESFARLKQGELTTKGKISDENLRNGTVSAFDDLLNKIRETSENEITLSKELTEDQIKAAHELAKTLEVLKMFQTRSGLRGLYEAGKISGSELVKESSVLRFNERREEGFSPNTGFSHMIESFTNELRFNLVDMFDDLDSAAADVADTMKSGFKGALYDFAKGTVNATQALRNLGLAIADKILQRSISFGVDSLVGAISGGASAAFSSFAKKSNGGIIKGYASGGMVSGGSGYKDDVPMMLAEGSYVIKKSSVAKYGPGLLSMLNDNRFDYNDALRPSSGSNVISPNLSNFALTDENNPQNALRMGRESELFQYTKDYADYEESKRTAMANFKSQKKNAIRAAYINAAIGIAGNVAGQGIKNYQARNPSSSIGIPYRSNNTGGWSGGNYTYAANGGLIRGFASGGPAGKDNIPALLMGGEFVMNRGAVNKYGINFFNRINSGSFSKFASGGLAGGYGSIQNSSSDSSGQLTDSIMRLIQSSESLKESLDKIANNKTGEPANSNAMASASGPVKIETTINIHMNNEGEAKAETNSKTTTNQGSPSKENSRALGEQLESVVLKVIMAQSRPGGLIYQELRR